jgi:hypothetical protein
MRGRSDLADLTREGLESYLYSFPTRETLGKTGKSDGSRNLQRPSYQLVGHISVGTPGRLLPSTRVPHGVGVYNAGQLSIHRRKFNIIYSICVSTEFTIYSI